MLIYLECAQSPLCNGVKIFLMRNDEGIVPFYCNILEKKKLFFIFFFTHPLLLTPSNRKKRPFCSLLLIKTDIEREKLKESFGFSPAIDLTWLSVDWETIEARGARKA